MVSRRLYIPQQKEWGNGKRQESTTILFFWKVRSTIPSHVSIHWIVSIFHCEEENTHTFTLSTVHIPDTPGHQEYGSCDRDPDGFRRHRRSRSSWRRHCSPARRSLPAVPATKRSDFMSWLQKMGNIEPPGLKVQTDGPSDRNTDRQKDRGRRTPDKFYDKRASDVLKPGVCVGWGISYIWGILK